MSLSAGSATAVATTPPTFAGSGMALAIANALYTAVSALASAQMAGGGFAAGVSTTLPNSTLFTIAQGVAAQANGIATGVISHITSNAVVNVAGAVTAHVTSESLGRTPNPNNPTTAILAPSAPVDIPLAGTGTLS